MASYYFTVESSPKNKSSESISDNSKGVTEISQNKRKRLAVTRGFDNSGVSKLFITPDNSPSKSLPFSSTPVTTPNQGPFIVPGVSNIPNKSSKLPPHPPYSPRGAPSIPCILYYSTTTTTQCLHLKNSRAI